MNFKYRARTSDGQIVEGYTEADDQKQALSNLRSRGMIVINLNAQNFSASGATTKKGGGSLKSLMNLDIGAMLSGGKVPMKSLMVFFRQLATMETAGLGLSSAISLIA